MRLTTQDIVRSVAHTLETDVLPTAPEGWPASYLRSALMLLTYLEDLATLEPELLRQDDRELRALLVDGADVFDAPDSDPALAARLHDSAALPDGDVTAYEARRAALCELIVAVYGHVPNPGVQRLAEGIADYRERSMAREDAVWKRAEALPIM
jgi:hypothetical protein